MKKVLVLSLLLLSFAGSAFAAQLLNNAVSGPGISLYGGADSTTIGVNPLAKFSTGVSGLVNYESATAKLSSGYAIFTKHINGSKIFGTAYDATNIFWKASNSKVLMLNSECAASTAYNSAVIFVPAGSWTSY